MNSIGIEISKNGITVGAVRYDRRAELLGKTFSPILDSAENTLRTAAEAAVSLLNEVSLTADDIDYVGVTVDSAVKDNIAYDSVLGKKTDLSAILKYLPVKKLVSVKRANALAICEQIQTYGALYSIAYVELDEKVGFGLLIGGKPYIGANGLAADIAHTTVQRGGKKCACGNCGCFEAYVSLDEYLNKSKDHAQYVSYLACGITNVMNLFQPNVIVVGGRVAELGGDELLKEFSELVHKEQYARNSVNKTLIALPTAGPDAAVIGAALAEI